MNLATRALCILVFLCAPSAVLSAEYVVDTEHQHAFIEFRVQHLGFSWMYGRFNEFKGHFTYEKGHPEAASVEFTVQTASIDTNNARRDKHLRSEDFLAVEKYPTAHFVSTGYEKTGPDSAILTGKLTLHGVTREIRVQVTEMRAGEDPWGGFRRGFIGTTTIRPANFNIDYDFGGYGQVVELTISFEGVRQSG